ncbi:MAG: CysS/YqeB C-terminal domain-containing protein, partial [Candidatus Saccharimonadales bacterium]
VSGLKLSKVSDISDKQKRLISEREKARQNQDWAQSDELRKELTRQSIGLNDTPHGAIWHRL